MRGSTAALMAAAALLLSPALLMLRLVSPAEAPDAYEQETRRMFAEWKAKYRKTYKYAGEEECRYAVFKEARRPRRPGPRRRGDHIRPQRPQRPRQ